MERYRSRVSGPLLERIDIHLEMASVSFSEMSLLQAAEDSATVRDRVMAAWERQRSRFCESERVLFNAQMGLPEIRAHCRLSTRPLGLLRMAVGRLGLSPRAFHKVLRLSRTIADLAASEAIEEAHVAEAIAYRVLDRGREGRGVLGRGRLRQDTSDGAFGVAIGELIFLALVRLIPKSLPGDPAPDLKLENQLGQGQAWWSWCRSGPLETLPPVEYEEAYHGSQVAQAALAGLK